VWKYLKGDSSDLFQIITLVYSAIVVLEMLAHANVSQFCWAVASGV